MIRTIFWPACPALNDLIFFKTINRCHVLVADVHAWGLLFRLAHEPMGLDKIGDALLGLGEADECRILAYVLLFQEFCVIRDRDVFFSVFRVFHAIEDFELHALLALSTT
jgi:hypothetical protein